MTQDLETDPTLVSKSLRVPLLSGVAKLTLRSFPPQPRSNITCPKWYTLHRRTDRCRHTTFADLSSHSRPTWPFQQSQGVSTTADSPPPSAFAATSLTPRLTPIHLPPAGPSSSRDKASARIPRWFCSMFAPRKSHFPLLAPAGRLVQQRHTPSRCDPATVPRRPTCPEYVC